MSGSIEAVLAEEFRRIDVDGCVHALDVDSRAEVGYQSDQPVVTASVFKLPVLVEFFRQADAGTIDLAEQVLVPVADRAPGPTGLSAFRHPVTMSWWDLALQMIVVSDNAATDIICDRVGLANVNATLARFGLPGTKVESDCRGIFALMAEDAGVASIDELPTEALRVGPASPASMSAPFRAELMAKTRALDPLLTNCTTPREIARLLSLVWTDQAASPSACAEMRRILSLQVWPHRLAAGFPEDDVTTAGKTGTLLNVRNEAGVVAFPHGRRFAVGVFVRSQVATLKNPASDAVIGRVARLTVDALRG